MHSKKQTMWRANLTEQMKNVRRRIVNMIYRANTSHLACAFSAAELLYAIYGLSNREKIRTWTPDRDRIILSKGHGIAAQLSVLVEYGLLSEAEAMKFCQNGDSFTENTSPFTPYIETATGSLGMGISYGVGAALGMKLKGYDDSRVYVIVGDGELNEGQCWEAVIQAGRMNLDNLFVLIDANGLAGIGVTCANAQWNKAFSSFGFDSDSLDGHDVDEIMEKLKAPHARPLALVCNTTKGKGVSFIENDNDWHYRPLSEADYHRALEELS